MTRTLERIAAAVDEAGLWRMHEEMARFGATPAGGVCREALTPEDLEARVRLAEWGRQAGLSLAVDAIGNMFLRREGREPGLAPVATGSHLDSQPTGGRFDGSFGVLAGLEALLALERAGVATRAPVELINWTNEEGGRFVPGVMGSGVYAEPATLDAMLAVRDKAGVRLGEDLAKLTPLLEAGGPVGERALGAPMGAFVEGHIEQAPRLEETGNVIGVVTGIQGTRKFQVEVLGEEAHAGTTPRRRRKDALLAAACMAQALHRMMEDADDLLRFTIGAFQAFPGAPSVVPGRVRFSIDFRHPDDALRARLGDRIRPLCEALAGPCEVRIEEPQAAASVDFHGAAIEAVRRAVEIVGAPHMDLYSGAGHDARNMARLCPSAMVFVPCEKGISHNEAENARPEHLAAGARVIAVALADLAGVV